MRKFYITVFSCPAKNAAASAPNNRMCNRFANNLQANPLRTVPTVRIWFITNFRMRFS